MEITAVFRQWTTLASNKLYVERFDDKNTKIYFKHIEAIKKVSMFLKDNLECLSPSLSTSSFKLSVLPGFLAANETY